LTLNWRPQKVKRHRVVKHSNERSNKHRERCCKGFGPVAYSCCLTFHLSPLSLSLFLSLPLSLSHTLSRKGTTALSTTTFSITTPSIMTFRTESYYNGCHLCHHCWVSFMLSITSMPFMLSIFMQNIVMVTVVMLNVVAPSEGVCENANNFFHMSLSHKCSDKHFHFSLYFLSPTDSLTGTTTFELKTLSRIECQHLFLVL